MMKTMIIDTSSDYLYISFLDNDKEIYQTIFEGRNNHSEHLIKFIEDGLTKNNLQVKDFNQIIVGIGPGSYTGIRLALSVAKMFAWTSKIPLFTISSLDILASGHYKNNQTIITTLRAKKNYVYTNVLGFKDGQLVRLFDDAFLSVADFEENILSKYHDYILVDQLYKFDALEIANSPFLSRVKDVHQIVPNYLRGVF